MADSEHSFSDDSNMDSTEEESSDGSTLDFSEDEEILIIRMYNLIGERWFLLLGESRAEQQRKSRNIGTPDIPPASEETTISDWGRTRYHRPRSLASAEGKGREGK